MATGGQKKSPGAEHTGPGDGDFPTITRRGPIWRTDRHESASPGAVKQGNDDGRDSGDRSGTVVSGVEAGAHRLSGRGGPGPETGGPDRPGAGLELAAIQAPVAQAALKVVAQVGGTREVVVAHQQPGSINEMLIGGHLGGQQTVDHLPVGGMEGMALVVGGHGGGMGGPGGRWDWA